MRCKLKNNNGSNQIVFNIILIGFICGTVFILYYFLKPKKKAATTVVEKQELQINAENFQKDYQDKYNTYIKLEDGSERSLMVMPTPDPKESKNRDPFDSEEIKTP